MSVLRIHAKPKSMGITIAWVYMKTFIFTVGISTWLYINVYIMESVMLRKPYMENIFANVIA